MTDQRTVLIKDVSPAEFHSWIQAGHLGAKAAQEHERLRDAEARADREHFACEDARRQNRYNGRRALQRYAEREEAAYTGLKWFIVGVACGTLIMSVALFVSLVVKGGI